jgi:hypothetical protein
MAGLRDTQQQLTTIKAKDAIRLLWVKNSALTLTKLFEKGHAG